MLVLNHMRDNIDHRSVRDRHHRGPISLQSPSTLYHYEWHMPCFVTETVIVIDVIPLRDKTWTLVVVGYESKNSSML